MATGTGERRVYSPSSNTIGRTGSDGRSRSAGTGGQSGERDARSIESIDLKFEWLQLCHGCGERKRFNALICDDCQRRHGV